jgi:hypothetical protein
MAYTLGEATKATGISKTSLHRAIKSGRISATKNDIGAWQIDPAELHRVYPPAANRNSSETSTLEQTGIASEIAVLRRELQLKDEERQRERVQLERTIDDLRERLDREGEERRKLTALLTDQRAKAPDVIVTPPPTSNVNPPPASPAEAGDHPDQQSPPRVSPIPSNEVGWWRRMVGGR